MKILLDLLPLGLKFEEKIVKGPHIKIKEHYKHKAVFFWNFMYFVNLCKSPISL